MIGITSTNAGVLFLPKNTHDDYVIFDIVEGLEKDPVEAQYLYSAAQDWREIEGSDERVILEQATKEYWLDQTVSHLQLIISGLEKSLEKRVLEHVEENIGPRVSSDDILSRLLIAPLADQYSPVDIAKSALVYGFAAVAHILDELAGLQPLVRRMTDIWLDLPERIFKSFSMPKEIIWRIVVEKGKMQELLTAACRTDFTAKWNLLVFHFDRPQDRLGIKTIGQELSLGLFPEEKLSNEWELIEAKGSASSRDIEEQGPDFIVYEKVEKQIYAIIQAISAGRDSNAKKFLKELIEKQTSLKGNISYAIKSLCNIAQRCADMFRTDFEARCLNKAMELDALDPWTLVQYANHLKRLGNYSKALEVCNRAEKIRQSTIVIASTADVYSQQGNYEEAINTYKIISNWQEDMVILNGIADNFRKMGQFEEAKAYYEKVISVSESSIEYSNNGIRGQVGLAEIAKKRGDLEEALSIYRRVLARRNLVYGDIPFFKLGLCNVLKLKENFEDAFEVVAEVVKDYPFALEARFIRGSILGLIGKELEGLEDLPEGYGSLSWREWLRPYYRGLLLLKLKRFNDAKRNLVENLSHAVVSAEEQVILRMASALYFLHENEIPKVDEILSKIPPLRDCHMEYLLLVLKLHSATQQKDISNVDFLKKQIDNLNIVDPILNKAIIALNEGNFSFAIFCEADAFLKQAA